MGFTKSIADVKVHQSMADYPRVEDGMSAEELKKKFDAPAEQLQSDLNKLVDELEDTAGAMNIGAMALTGDDTSANNVQAKLLYILEQIQNTVLSQIPDGTITKAKINTEYANKLAEKDGTLQENLNAQLINGNTDLEMYRSMIKIGNYTGNSSESQTIDVGFKPTAVVVSAIKKDYVYDYRVQSLDNNGLITADGFNIGYETTGGWYSATNVLTDTGFTVNKPKKGTEKTDVCGLNISNQKYSYIAFR